MNYDVACITNKGGKAVNEDSVWVKQFPAGIAVCVADGLGSHGGGDIASRAVVDVLETQMSNSGYSEDSLIEKWFHDADNSIVSLQTPQMPMKSTGVLLVVENANAKFAHVGDSRGYMFSANKVLAQTLDHSIPQMDVFRGNITPAEIRFHDARNQILQALGAGGKAEITHLRAPGQRDAFLLCTDGFWEYVYEEEMEIDLLKSESAAQWLSYMISRLSSRVPDDHDNISVIAVICG